MLFDKISFDIQDAFSITYLILIVAKHTKTPAGFFCGGIYFCCSNDLGIFLIFLPEFKSFSFLDLYFIYILIRTSCVEKRTTNVTSTACSAQAASRHTDDPA